MMSKKETDDLVNWLNKFEWDMFITFHYRKPNYDDDPRTNKDYCVELNERLDDYLLSYLNPNRTKARFYETFYAIEQGTNNGKYTTHHCHLLLGKIPSEAYFYSKKGREYLAKRDIFPNDYQEKLTRTEKEYFIKSVLKSAVFNGYSILESYQNSIDIRPVYEQEPVLKYCLKQGFEAIDQDNTKLLPKNLRKKQ